jgi:hypothetical protein
MRNPAKPLDPATQTAPKVAGGASGVPGTPADVTLSPPPTAGAMMGKRPPGPRPKKFRVVNGGYIVFNGARTVLRAGKEIDETQYDLAQLERQGIILKEVLPAAAARPAEEPEVPAGPGGVLQPGQMSDFKPHESQQKTSV